MIAHIICRDDFLKYINVYKENHKHFDFIGRCITPWHLIGLKAYLQKMYNEKQRNLYGILVIEKHQRDGVVLDVENLNFDENIIINIIQFEEEKNSYKLNKTVQFLLNTKFPDHVDSEISIIAPNTPWLFLAGECKQIGLDCKLMVVDEGIANYNGLYHWLLGNYQENKKLKGSILILIRKVIAFLLKLRLGLEEERFMLFNSTKDKLIRNDNAIKYYRQVINKETNFEQSIELKKNYIIIFTQPFIEDEVIEKEVLFELYNILQILLEDKGYSVYFKIHPREKSCKNYIDAGFNVLKDQSSSAEQYIGSLKNKPDYIFSFHSTVLISLTLFYDLQAISLNHIIENHLKGNYLKNAFKSFENNFKHLVNFPKSLNELNDYVNNRGW